MYSSGCRRELLIAQGECMDTFVLTSVIIYALLLISYMTCKALGRRTAFRGVNKVLLVLVYLALTVYAVLLNTDRYAVVVLVALVFTAGGDIFLLWGGNRKMFHCGVVSFGIGNALLIVFALYEYGWQWWSLLIFAFLYCLNLYLQYRKVYTYGSSKWFLNIYLIFVGYSGCLGLSNAIVSTATPALMYGLGTFMFFISDILLGMYHFKLRKAYVDVLNSLFYFGGIMLVVLSFFI